MSRAKGAAKKGSVLERLEAAEAEGVLHRLLAAHPALRAEAETIARSQMGMVNFEVVADEVDDAVRSLDIDDLNRRAGRHEWGYVEPTEAAWEVLEESMQPFIADIKRRIDLGLEADALEICKGVVLGLHRIEQAKAGGLLEWAPDFPAEAAGDAIETWCKEAGKRKVAGGGPRRIRPPFPQEFTDRLVPKWREMIARTLPDQARQARGRVRF